VAGGTDNADVGACTHDFPGPATTGVLFSKLYDIANLNVDGLHFGTMGGQNSRGKDLYDGYEQMCDQHYSRQKAIGGNEVLMTTDKEPLVKNQKNVFHFQKKNLQFLGIPFRMHHHGTLC